MDNGKIIIEVLPQFEVLYNLPKDINIICCIGGRGGAKTYEVSKWITYEACIRTQRCAVLRDEKSTIKESILNEVLLRYDTANENGALEQTVEKLDTGLKNIETGEMLVFTKGFRASKNETTANLKSISNVDRAIIEETEDIRDARKFNKFADSIRKHGSVIVLVLNTPDINHWIIKRYFNCTPAKDINGNEIDGFFDISPKNIPGFLCIRTNFRDNPYLAPHIYDNYIGYGTPGHYLYDPFYYYTAIEGYASSGRMGQIIKKAKPMLLKDYLSLPYPEVFGQDFGTASPAGMIGVKFYKNNCYTRQINYLPMSTLKIGILYCELGLTDKDLIIADHADAEALNLLYYGFDENSAPEDILEKYPQLRKGFNVEPCEKGPDSIRFGINLINGMSLFVCEESTDYWQEINNYVYAQDKWGNYVSDPIDNWNHLIDPLRYVVRDRYEYQST